MTPFGRIALTVVLAPLVLVGIVGGGCALAFTPFVLSSARDFENVWPLWLGGLLLGAGAIWLFRALVRMHYPRPSAAPPPLPPQDRGA